MVDYGLRRANENEYVLSLYTKEGRRIVGNDPYLNGCDGYVSDHPVKGTLNLSIDPAHVERVMRLFSNSGLIGEIR